MYAALSKHVSWVFFPARFLFGKSLDSVLKIKGWETLYFVDQPDEVKAVNGATGGVFLGGAGNEFLKALLGPQSLFCLDHQQHRLARRIMGPELTKKSVMEWTPCIDGIIAEELAMLRNRRSVKVGKWSRQVCMRIVCRVALGLDEPQQLARILARFENATGYLANVVSYAKPLWKANGQVSLGALTEWFVKRVDDEIYPLIARERARLNKASETELSVIGDAMNPSTPGSVLQKLVFQQKKYGYDDAFVRDNLVALLAAGYDTSGSALSWMIYWLCREQGSLDRLTNSLADGDKKSLEAFRNEVLRYCPPIEILPRRIDSAKQAQAHSLVAGLHKLATTGVENPMVCPFIHRIHHNPDTYAEPGSFSPDRFMGAKKYNNNEFLPFGAGHRMCIGINLGKCIMDQALAGLIQQQIKLETQQTSFKPIRRNVSIWPGHSLRVTVVRN